MLTVGEVKLEQRRTRGTWTTSSPWSLKTQQTMVFLFHSTNRYFWQGLDEELAYAVGKDFGDDYLRWKQDHQYASTKKQVKQSNEDFIEPEHMIDLMFRFANGWEVGELILGTKPRPRHLSTPSQGRVRGGLLQEPLSWGTRSRRSFISNEKKIFVQFRQC